MLTLIPPLRLRWATLSLQTCIVYNGAREGRFMAELREQVAGLLRAGLDHSALAQELEALAAGEGFGATADLWAPALYARDPRYFAPFLARHLTAAQSDVITALLPRLEADGQTDLFSTLYRVATNEQNWNADLAHLVAALSDDAALAQAVRLRGDVPGNFALYEDLAVALYRRLPALFAQTFLAHVQPSYDWQNNRPRDYRELRQTAKAQSDEAVYWRLFRTFADTSEWKIEISRLAQQNVSSDAIVAELVKRRLDQPMNMDADLLVTFVDTYGPALVPFVEANLDWFGQLKPDAMLEAIERLGDVGLFRRVFFRFGRMKEWNEAIRKLVAATPDDAALATALQRWQPPTMQLQPRDWWLDADLALKLYQRNANLFRPFLLSTLHNPPIALFDEAEDAGDETFLDALTFGFIDELATRVSTTFPFKPTVAFADFAEPQQGWIRDWSQAINDRFDRLYNQASEAYTQHAANILCRGLGAAWKLRDDIELHPVAYLCQKYRAAWAQSSTAIRDLLETPDAHINELALTFLEAGGAATAARLVEALPSLAALLLGPAKSPLKRQILRLLEAAAATNPTYAAQLAPMLEELMHFHNATRLGERAMVSFVRARHYAQQPA